MVRDMAQREWKNHGMPILTRAGWVLSALLSVSCSAAKPSGTCRPGSADISLPGGEVRIEETLLELDLLEAEVYSSMDAPGNPIDTCVHSNSEVIARGLAFRLATGSEVGARDKIVEKKYYALLQDGTAAEIMPIIHLRQHYYEGLRKCVMALVHGVPQEVQEKSPISILVAANFEAETRNGMVVVDFVTPWCVPCKKMAHDMERLARDYKGKLSVGRLNVDRHMALAEKHGVKVFPTLVVLKNGREVARLAGLHSYAELTAWAQRVLHEQSSD